VFERFTDRARHAFVAANDEARTLGDARLGSGHLLLGLLHDPESDAGRILVPLGITLDAARDRLRAHAGDTPRAAPRDAGETPAREAVEFTPEAKDVLERSLRAALRLGGARIGTGHLVLGLLDVAAGDGRRVLTAFGVDPGTLRRDATTTIRCGVESGERPPTGPVVVRELSPEARRAMQTALQLGSAYLGRRYAPVRMLRRASGAGRAVRSLTSDPGSGPSTPSLEAGPGPVPATCASCGTPSPVCGTLYMTARGALVCERCLGRAG
jgi:ATP-dependent Clp protease ATP-binding subunit ClpA